MLFLEGEFHVLKMPIQNYQQGSEKGIYFPAGDSNKLRVAVFVKTDNTKFAEKVQIGQRLKYNGAVAKYDGKFYFNF